MHGSSSLLIDNNLHAIKALMERLTLYGIELVNANYDELIEVSDGADFSGPGYDGNNPDCRKLAR